MNMIYVRTLNWNNLDADGIPKDCLEIMEFFNYALEHNLFPYVPRKTPITKEQILQKWIPKKDENITFVATDSSTNKVIAGATAFVNKEKNTAEINVTKNPLYTLPGVGTALLKETINLCLARGYTVSIHTSVENKSVLRIMEKLGYYDKELIKDLKEYRENLDVGTADAWHWTINSLV